MVFLRTLLISSLLSLPLALHAEGPAPLPFDDPNYTPPAVTPQPLAPTGEASGDKPDCKTVMVKKTRRAKPVPVTRCSKPPRTAEPSETRAEDGERHCKTVMVKKTRRSKAVAETRCSGSSSRATEARSEHGSTAASQRSEPDCKPASSRKGRKATTCAQSKHEATSSSRSKKGKAAAEDERKGKSGKTEKASKSKTAAKETVSKKKRK